MCLVTSLFFVAKSSCCAVAEGCVLLVRAAPSEEFEVFVMDCTTPASRHAVTWVSTVIVQFVRILRSPLSCAVEFFWSCAAGDSPNRVRSADGFWKLLTFFFLLHVVSAVPRPTGEGGHSPGTCAACLLMATMISLLYTIIPRRDPTAKEAAAVVDRALVELVDRLETGDITEDDLRQRHQFLESRVVRICDRFGTEDVRDGVLLKMKQCIIKAFTKQRLRDGPLHTVPAYVRQLADDVRMAQEQEEVDELFEQLVGGLEAGALSEDDIKHSHQSIASRVVDIGERTGDQDLADAVLFKMKQCIINAFAEQRQRDGPFHTVPAYIQQLSNEVALVPVEDETQVSYCLHISVRIF